MDLLGAALSAFGSIFGGESQADAQREANEANIQLQREQNQWNLDQWNRENEYNSAISQRQRLEEAGLNPYIMMNGSSAGSASSLTSAPSPTVQPVNRLAGVGNALGDFINSYYNQRINQERLNQMQQQTEGMKIQNQINAASLPYAAKMAEVAKDQSLSNLENSKIQQSINSLERDQRELDYHVNVQFQQKTSLQNLENLKKQFDMLTQQLANLKVVNNLTNQQVKTEIVRRYGVILQNQGISLDNRQKSQMIPILVRQANHQADLLEFQARQAMRYDQLELDSDNDQHIPNYKYKYKNSLTRDYWSTYSSPISSFFQPLVGTVGTAATLMK